MPLAARRVDVLHRGIGLSLLSKRHEGGYTPWHRGGDRAKLWPMKNSHAIGLKSTALSLMLAAAGIFPAVALVGGCAATPTSDSTGQYVDDTVITTKVKNALLADGAVKSTQISVETVKGVVQLSGFVNSSDESSAAKKDAKSIPGVKEVSNDLIVK